MIRTQILIIFLIVLLFNLNCDKEKIFSNPLIQTLDVKYSEWWNGVNYLQFIYIGEGKVLSDGGGKLIQAGICYSTTNELPTISDTYSTGVHVNGYFTCRLNLQAGQVKYYLRAFAKNEAGIGYGNSVTFISCCTDDFDSEMAYKTTPSRLLPEDGVIVSPFSVTLSWIQGTGGSYDLYLDLRPDVKTKIVTDVKSSSYTLDSLKPLTTYYWKVVKRWGSCSEISSAIYKFTTSQ